MTVDSPRSRCRICGNESGNNIHRLREMFLGTGDSFEFLGCTSGGTIQIVDSPDLTAYYPEEYYSFESVPDARHSRNGLKYLLCVIGDFLRQKAASYWCGKRTPVDRLLYNLIMKVWPRLFVGFPPYLKEK